MDQKLFFPKLLTFFLGLYSLLAIISRGFAIYTVSQFNDFAFAVSRAGDDFLARLSQMLAPSYFYLQIAFIGLFLLAGILLVRNYFNFQNGKTINKNAYLLLSGTILVENLVDASLFTGIHPAFDFILPVSVILLAFIALASVDHLKTKKLV